MNAATRVIAHGEVIARHEPIEIHVSESKILLMLFVVLISALAFIYVKDLNRQLFIDYQQLQSQTEQLQTDSNKLLLEQSAWSSQARVQQIAEQQMDMLIPATKDVVMLKV